MNKHVTRSITANDNWTTVTRRGQKVKKPEILTYETNNAFRVAEINYYKVLEDLNDFESTEIAVLAGAIIKDEI